MDMRTDDPRVNALLQLERHRIQRLGYPAYLLEIQGLADAAGIPPDQLLVPFQDILSGGPATFTGLSPDQAARAEDPVIHLLKDANVCAMRAMQAVLILFAIEYYRGNESETARRLRISRTTLGRWLKSLGVSSREIRERHEAGNPKQQKVDST